MVSFFITLLRLSITGSIFVLAVVLLRLIFRKAPRWVFCMLWGLAALHLLLPVTIHSSFSLQPKPVVSGETMEMLTESYVGEVEYIYEDAPQFQQALNQGRVPVQTDRGSYIVARKGTVEPPATVADTVLPVLFWVWAAGTALIMVYLMVSFLLLRRKMATATLWKENIRQSEQVKSPFVLGLFRPVIYLPYHMPSEDMAHVIAHEQAHLRRKDHWWKPIGFLILSVYWFNPVMWLAYILLCRDIEAACDEKVIRDMDRDSVRAYSAALLNCAVHRRAITACPLAFGEVSVKERIKRVMHYKKPAFWIVLLAVAASLVAAALLLTAPAEEAKPQTEQTEPTEPTVPQTDSQAILALVDRIINNPAVATSSNPYDYINAGYDAYVKILQYEDTATTCLLSALKESSDNGLREYIMAAACAELTGFGVNKEQTPWGSGKEWLQLFEREQSLGGEILGTEEDTVGALIGVDSLLGIDCAVMRIVAVEDHPSLPGKHRYSYRFQYYGDGTSYDWDGQEWYLVEIHSCLDYKLGDFDHDGIVELFYYTDTEQYPYYICDRVGDTLMETGYNQVPDAVMDYDILLNQDVYYLYHERWEWFLNDPLTYIREVVKLPQDRLYFSCPAGVIPEGTDMNLVEDAYQVLLDYLKEPRSTYEKKVTYRIMTVMEYTYQMPLIPGQIDYQVLFEKWGFTQSASTEEDNCYRQMVQCFQVDPAGFVKGMVERKEFPWPKDMCLAAGRIAHVNFLYDAQNFEAKLRQLESGDLNSEELEMVALLRECFETWEAPALNRQALLDATGEELWYAFFYAPDQVLETLADIYATADAAGLRRPLGPLPYRDEMLMEKGFAAIERLLSRNPTQAQKDAAYPFLMSMELYGGYRDGDTPGEPYDYESLFDKLTYADGAFAELYMSQAGDIYEEDPAAFIRELTAWARRGDRNRIVDNIAMSFAYRFLNSDSYLKILFGLSDGMPETNQREIVQIFIDAYQTVQRTVE